MIADAHAARTITQLPAIAIARIVQSVRDATGVVAANSLRVPDKPGRVTDGSRLSYGNDDRSTIV
ncbi:MAG: hypothetical protein NVS4B3_12760 [Gemmatimonadaceae bacterium]